MAKVLLQTLLSLALTLTLLAGGCGREDGTGEPVTGLRIGVLPDESPDSVRAHYEPLVSYLEKTVGIPCVLVVPDSYESLLTRFRAREIDVAYFGGLTFVAARELAGAVPLAMRAEDRAFVSYSIVPGLSTAGSIDDLAGSRVAFGPRLSTSGHVMPRYFLERRGITPEQFFGAVQYTGSHEATAMAVSEGEADVGFANSLLIDAMLRDGRLAPGDIRILDESPPYADYVWTARQGLPEAVAASILDAFLALSSEREEHRHILRAMDAAAFYPAAADAFDELTSVAKRLGLVEELR